MCWIYFQQLRPINTAIRGHGYKSVCLGNSNGWGISSRVRGARAGEYSKTTLPGGEARGAEAAPCQWQERGSCSREGLVQGSRGGKERRSRGRWKCRHWPPWVWNWSSVWPQVPRESSEPGGMGNRLRWWGWWTGLEICSPTWPCIGTRRVLEQLCWVTLARYPDSWASVSLFLKQCRKHSWPQGGCAQI